MKAVTLIQIKLGIKVQNIICAGIVDIREGDYRIVFSHAVSSDKLEVAI